MKPNERQKICPGCDGRIPIESNECPYCAADLTEEATSAASASQGPLFKNQSLQASLASLYTPPYSAKTPQFSVSPEQPSSLKKPAEAYKEVSSSPRMGDPAVGINTVEEEQQEAQSHFWPLLILSAGSLLLIVGLLQLFFSDNGKLRLEWDSSYWFIYCLGALPFLFFGFKRVNQIK